MSQAATADPAVHGQAAKRPLRIVHCLTETCGPESVNGVLKAAYQLGEAQRALGHQVVMFTTVGAAAGGGGARSRGLPTPQALFWRVTAGVSPRLAADVIATRPDVVHFHSIHIPQNVGIAAALRRAGVPYCVTVHGGLSPTARRRRRIRKAVFGWLGERQYLSKAGFIHALTPEEASDIRLLIVPRSIVVAPNGIDIGGLARSEDRTALSRALPAVAGRRVYLYLGRLDPTQKGLDMLIEAFAHADVEDAVLVLVGPDWKDGRARLERLAGTLGLGRRVLFHEPVFGTRRADFMAAAEVFVHPSRWEGVSLAVLEAAASRKACLLTRDADPLHELERAQAAVVVDSTHDSLVTGIRALAAMDRAQLGELGDRANAAVARTFDWRTTAEVLVQAYRDLRSGSPAPSNRG